MKEMKEILRTITSKKCIYIVFLSVYSAGLIWLIVTGKSDALEYMSYKKLIVAKFLSFSIYLLLSYLSLRNIKIATLIMAVLILLSGAGSTLMGVFRVSWNQFILKPYFVIFGLYFTFGAVSLIYKSAIKSKQL